VVVFRKEFAEIAISAFQPLLTSGARFHLSSLSEGVVFTYNITAA
jgi:hypothetical protein